MTTDLSADYVIYGCGAVGMAFADVILQESQRDIIIVDRNAKPGGHWNFAYPFVRLHQPSNTYGVSSRSLGKGRIEIGGLNHGLGELATGSEVLAYFEDIMRHDFIPTGRIRYFPMCNYEDDGKFTCRLSGEQFQAKARRRLVNASFMTASVPAIHKPNFAVAPGVNFIPINKLVDVDTPPDQFVIIGGGKTGVDACLWLLDNRVPPEKITWIVSRDAWYLDRQKTQVSEEFFVDTLGGFADQFSSIAESSSVPNMLERLEACGYFVRLFPDVEPKMFHGATISLDERDALLRLKNIVRMGHVTEITPTEIRLKQGVIPTTPGTVHVDCSATPLTKKPAQPVFTDGGITLQMIRPYQPVFSAALIAYTDLNYENDDTRNALTQPVPLPDSIDDYIRFTFGALVNQRAWGRDKTLSAWIRENRLDGAGKLLSDIDPTETEKIAIQKQIRTNAPLAATKLFEYLGAIENTA